MPLSSSLTRASRPAGLLLALAIMGGSLGSAAPFPDDDQTIRHVLNRMAYGPRSGDVQRIKSIGLSRYIDEQLHPDRIADSAMSGRLEGLTTLALSSREIAERFAIPQMEARRAKKQAPQQPQADEPSPNEMAMRQRANTVMMELGQQKLLRGIYSECQLQEVLTDVWFNHFNVDARKGADRFLLTSYERDVIRPHVLGHFRELLGATAKSPAMLFFLDNWMSADPSGPHPVARTGAAPRPFGGRFALPRPQVPQGGQGNVRRGLNENYGRELMELHTLGVDGGYTQTDVTEVARAFTGWTIQNPRLGGDFRFDPRIHDRGEKIVLGHRIKAGGGQSDGEEVLDILAAHPSTARHIATKLAIRFVSDTPSDALVNRVADRFRESDGDLREVMRAILRSPEFLSPAVHRIKVKTPLDFIVSAVRAVDADVRNAMPLVRAMQQLGEPLYQCQPPTGYKDTADAWVNTGALVNRMNFAVSLSGDRLMGMGRSSVVDRESSVEGRDALVERLLGTQVSESTRTTIAKATTPAQIAALTLGSPEFQRR